VAELAKEAVGAAEPDCETLAVLEGEGDALADPQDVPVAISEAVTLALILPLLHAEGEKVAL